MAKRKKIGHWFYRFSVEDAKRTAGFILIVIILFIIGSMLLASCGVSKKSRSSSRSSVDSSATTSKVSEGKSQESATVDKSKDSSWESEVSVEFDTDAEERAKELAGPKDTAGQKAGKNIPKNPQKIFRPPLPSPGKVHKVKVNGKTIESTVPIKSATIRENGQTRQLDITEITRQDSGRQEEKGTVKVERKEQAKDRNSFSWKIPWWVYLLIIGGGITAWRYGWFKVQKDHFTVKYKSNGKSKNTDQT